MPRLFSTVFVISLVLTGCAWVSLSEEAELVRVADAEQVTDCRRSGETSMRVRDRVAGFERKPGKVAEEVERLARNEAAELGGDRIVALGPVRDGQRSYAVFACRKN